MVVAPPRKMYRSVPYYILLPYAIFSSIVVPPSVAEITSAADRFSLGACAFISSLYRHFIESVGNAGIMDKIVLGAFYVHF